MICSCTARLDTSGTSRGGYFSALLWSERSPPLFAGNAGFPTFLRRHFSANASGMTGSVHARPDFRLRHRSLAIGDEQCSEFRIIFRLFSKAVDHSVELVCGQSLSLVGFLNRGYLSKSIVGIVPKILESFRLLSPKYRALRRLFPFLATHNNRCCDARSIVWIGPLIRPNDSWSTRKIVATRNNGKVDQLLFNEQSRLIRMKKCEYFGLQSILLRMSAYPRARAFISIVKVARRVFSDIPVACLRIARLIDEMPVSVRIGRWDCAHLDRSFRSDWEATPSCSQQGGVALYAMPDDVMQGVSKCR